MKSQQNNQPIENKGESHGDFKAFVPKNPLSEKEVKKLFNDLGNINCLRTNDGGEAFFAVEAFAVGVANRNTTKYPQLLTNNTGTVVRLLLHEPCNEKDCEQGCGSVFSSTHTYWKKIQENFVIPQLEYAYRQMFPNASNQPFCEVREAYGVREYQFNVTPEQMNEILLLSQAYTGYRHGASVLLLSKQFEMKEGVICLFPVMPFPDSKKGEYVIRADGCQFTEIPNVQWLRLLPNFSGKEPGPSNTHTFPYELNKALPDGKITADIIAEMMCKQLMLKPPEKYLKTYLEKEKGNFTPEEVKEMEELNEFTLEQSYTIVRQPKEGKGPLRIVPIDERAKRIYLIYGNNGEQELSHCYSLEVPVLALLEIISKKLDHYLKTVSEENRPDLEKSIATISQMMATEKLRLKTKGASASTTTSAKFWDSKPLDIKDEHTSTHTKKSENPGPP